MLTCISEKLFLRFGSPHIERRPVKGLGQSSRKRIKLLLASLDCGAKTSDFFYQSIVLPYLQHSFDVINEEAMN